MPDVHARGAIDHVDDALSVRFHPEERPPGAVAGSVGESLPGADPGECRLPAGQVGQLGSQRVVGHSVLEPAGGQLSVERIVGREFARGGWG